VKQQKRATEDELRSFKTGDLVDVKGPSRRGSKTNWSGPYKLMEYRLDRGFDGKPAAYVTIDLGQKKELGRWLMAGENQFIRKHVSKS
jgi:hypothetical protein